uniref:Uncharacterized protein n=1 Tax=Oryza sativa subsp. japonica TaxID=39947 RepID=Q6ZBX4_ORYSJ|nr:hypothetical protein [Oryza sativa Japonica Group]
MWYLLKGVVLTKDNLARRNWNGSLRATHWLRFWAQLQRCDEDEEFLKVACRKLETTVIQLFANYGWRFTNRLQ